MPMPLIKGKSKAAFKQNVKTEAKTKPIKQAVAIAFSVKRKSGDSFKQAKAARIAQSKPKKKKLTAFA